MRLPVKIVLIIKRCPHFRRAFNIELGPLFQGCLFMNIVILGMCELGPYKSVRGVHISEVL